MAMSLAEMTCVDVSGSSNKKLTQIDTTMAMSLAKKTSLDVSDSSKHPSLLLVGVNRLKGFGSIV